MVSLNDFLRAELERLFDLDEMKRLSSKLLGLNPEEVGGTSSKGSFARSLVERCANDDALQAYLKDPKSRELGFAMTFIPSAVLLVWALVAALMQMD